MLLDNILLKMIIMKIYVNFVQLNLAKTLLGSRIISSLKKQINHSETESQYESEDEKYVRVKMNGCENKVVGSE